MFRRILYSMNIPLPVKKNEMEIFIEEHFDYIQFNSMDYTPSGMAVHLMELFPEYNFSRSGFESRHNLVYWNNCNYYGFGCGASGYIDNIRYDNTRSLTKYIKGDYRLNEDILDRNTIIENEFILGLRKINGINIYDFNHKYGNIFNDVVNRLIKEGKLINDGVNIYINPVYIYVSNSILVDFIGEKYE